MIIELKGVNLKNKGAYLMLKAILTKVRERYPQATIVAELGYGLNNKELASQGMKQKFRKNGTSKKERVIRFFPQPLRKALGIITTADVDVVLEGSGFAYGDDWEVAKINKRLVQELAIYKTNKAKVILLPQAFGPFRKLETQESLTKITTQADLIFARDTVSLDHLTRTFGAKGSISQAPDFTNLLKPTKADYVTQPYENGVLVIPNFKMNTLQGQDVTELYLQFLQKTVAFFQQANEKVFFLNHERELDQAIAQAVNQRLTTPIEIIQLEDPLHIKAVIGVAKIVVTSRFHGLVSSLSQAVPTLCTSWSHKYHMLMQEYEQGDYLLDIRQTQDNELELLLQSFNQPANLERIKAVLAHRSQHFYTLSERMWSRVFDCMDKKLS